MSASTKSRTWLAIALVVVVVLGAVGLEIAKNETDPVRTVLAWLWRLDYWAFPVEGRTELAVLHQSASGVSRARCVACHEDKKSSKLVLHRIHLRSALLANLECHDCHRHVDLTTRGNRAVVTWVDVGFCKKCHSAFPGLQHGTSMRPEYYDRDCTTCHKGEQAPKHAARYLPRVTPSSECQGCHGGRVLPSTIRHERSDWLKTHGTEALEVGSDACYRCHDFGLKFCDACHAKKPPTHLPAERWRTIHPAEARRDTRVCYSCHRLSFCKTCHLNHEEGWMQRHSDFVREQGDTSCTECHSESACGYCHTQMSDVIESTSTE